MSEIDSYKHECLGIIRCPSSYWPPFAWHGEPMVSGGDVPIYLLHEDAEDAVSFRAKRGDILVGGGSGESPALRISMPETFIFYTTDDYEEFVGTELHCAYWTISEAFIFGDGYAKLGWEPSKNSLEVWLVRHILAFVFREYPDLWTEVWGSEALDEDGAICRLPTVEERAIL